MNSSRVTDCTHRENLTIVFLEGADPLPPYTHNAKRLLGPALNAPKIIITSSSSIDLLHRGMPNTDWKWWMHFIDGHIFISRGRRPSSVVLWDHSYSLYKLQSLSSSELHNTLVVSFFIISNVLQVYIQMELRWMWSDTVSISLQRTQPVSLPTTWGILAQIVRRCVYRVSQKSQTNFFCRWETPNKI